MNGFEEVFRNEFPWKVNMLIAQLQENHIPCFTQFGVASGLTLSPFAFAYLLPDIEIIVYVPPQYAKRAGIILNHLPFNPGNQTLKELDGLPDMTRLYFNRTLAFLALPPIFLGIVAAILNIAKMAIH